MQIPPHRRYAAALVALVTIAIAAFLAREPRISSVEQAALAERFRFTATTLLDSLHVPARRYERQVNPAFQHFAGWISSVGAAVALNDLDGDGLPNDLCMVDPRLDQIIVAPVPGSGARYEPLLLEPQPLPFDRATMAPMGCLPGDLNEDGEMDLVAYYWGRTPIAFMRAASGYRPTEIAATQERWFTNAATFADLDADGHADLVIANYFADGSRILDAQATVADEMPHSMSRAYNGGHLHFFVWAGASEGEVPDVVYKEVAAQIDAPQTGWALAVGAADLDNDALPDLYVANDFGPDRLLHNRSQPGALKFTALEGRRGFTTPRSKVVGRDSFKGMGVDFSDVNGDGLLDFCVSNIAAEYALEESHFMYVSTGQPHLMQAGVAPYVDRSEELGTSRSDWSWDCRFADFDNDGAEEMLQATGFLKGETDRWPELQELAMGNDELMPSSRVWFRAQQGDDLSGHAQNAFFVAASDGRYYDLAAQLGVADEAVTRGIATADVDGDGDMDFATVNQWDDSRFYRNDCQSCGNFLSLHLRLPIAGAAAEPFGVYSGPPHKRGRPALGASVVVTLPDGRRRVAQVDGGNGHSGKRSSELHFGLGATPVDARLDIEVRWRDVGGKLRRHALTLAPGSHTLLLGTQEGDAA